MDFLPFPLSFVLAGAFIAMLAITLFLNVFGLPANWIIIGLAALWKLAHPGAENMNIVYWIFMVGIALLGEALEFCMQVMKARRYGSSSSGAFAGMVGAIVGAILLAPLFWGIGALLGALAGAWTGCFLMELARGRPGKEALDAAFGAMMGRFLGTVCKFGIGAVMIAVTAERVWPALPPELRLEPGWQPDAEQIQALLLAIAGAC